ncbi:MAG: sigma-70 family RNA polymerase sigma factor [Cycloclasticus sp.]
MQSTSSAQVAPVLSTTSNKQIRKVYTQHHGWLTGWLTKMLGCPHNAADLSQDTFVRVMTRTDISTVDQHRPWLITIAKRLLIDKTRRAKLEKAYLEGLTISPQIESAASSEQLLIAMQTLQLLASALESLPDNARKAFIMRHINGQTQSAIADQLGISSTMVRKYLVQGLVACHSFIEDIPI